MSVSEGAKKVWVRVGVPFAAALFVAGLAVVSSEPATAAAFANLELVLALATIRQRYRLEPTSHDDARPVPIVALSPDRPIRLRLIRS